MRSLGLDVSALDVDERLGVELERRLGGAATVARVERSAASVSAERPLLRRLRKPASIRTRAFRSTAASPNGYA